MIFLCIWKISLNDSAKKIRVKGIMWGKNYFREIYYLLLHNYLKVIKTRPNLDAVKYILNDVTLNIKKHLKYSSVNESEFTF